MFEELWWSDLRGTRAKKAWEFLCKPVQPSTSWILAIAVEPLRVLSRILFFVSREPSGLGGKTYEPALLMFANAKATPVLPLLQYISGCLHGSSCSRLLILVRLAGATDVADLLTNRQDIISLIRRHMLVASSWMWRRHWRDLVAWPFKLALVANSRLDLEDREEIQREWAQACPQCLDPFLTRRLAESGLVKGHDGLMSPVWQRFLLAWASAVDMTTLQLEMRHARQKTLMPHKTGVALPCETLATHQLEARNCALKRRLVQQHRTRAYNSNVAQSSNNQTHNKTRQQTTNTLEMQNTSSAQPNAITLKTKDRTPTQPKHIWALASCWGCSWILTPEGLELLLGGVLQRRGLHDPQERASVALYAFGRAQGGPRRGGRRQDLQGPEQWHQRLASFPPSLLATRTKERTESQPRFVRLLGSRESGVGVSGPRRPCPNLL